jgi:hypothetical protein
MSAVALRYNQANSLSDSQPANTAFPDKDEELLKTRWLPDAPTTTMSRPDSATAITGAARFLCWASVPTMT